MNPSPAPRSVRPVSGAGLFSLTLPLLCLAALLAAAGCARHKGTIEIDPRYSLNVAKPPAGFPDKKLKLSPSESELIARHGPPDYIRIWWRPDGSFIRSSDLSGKMDKLPEMLGTARKSWIYMNDDKEYVIRPGGGGYKEQKIDEVTKLVCTYGDPSSRSVPALRSDGAMHETWQWVEYGIMVELADGHEISRSHFTPTGAGTYLGK